MEKEKIFQLIVDRKDKEAKEEISKFTAGSIEEKNQNNKNEIAVFLNKKLTKLSDIEEIDTIEIYAHYAGLELVAKNNGSAVEDFHMELLDVDDTGTYK